MGVVQSKDDAGLTLGIDTPLSFGAVPTVLHADSVDLGPKDLGTVDVIIQHPYLKKRPWWSASS